MRFIYFIISGLLLIALCVLLDTRIVLPVPFGKILSPQEGLWQNAESVGIDYSSNFNFDQLEGKVDVYFDDRLVPHIFAEKENDAYFVQGFLHAKFRLWQMELQALSAAGRASEVVGDVALIHDREFRRLGMVYAAENSLKEMEKDQATKSACDAYTDGVNTYISTLTKSKLPIEYKLLGCEPEKWTNLKTALFLKYMSYDLAGHENDFEMTNARNYFSKSDFDLLFPMIQDSLVPIIPKGTVFSSPKIKTKIPPFADSIYFKFLKETPVAEEFEKPDPSNGSNNWAISGKKTRCGAPILCNDPHLGLTLPSLWYEMQISVPSHNVYGVSFPGAPSIIIGFNDSCAFGFTNAGRDVRDYYEIKFKDKSKNEYWFNNEWIPTSKRIERIKILGKPDFIDTVTYTKFGPVMYDNNFSEKINNSKLAYAVRWTAHEKSNELKMFYLLNRARNYQDYQKAVKYLKTPGQNCVFAAKNGEIAIKNQGNFPAKWVGQGDFVMPGFDDSYAWQGMIPEDENPFLHNPPSGFVSSANQRPTDSAYPYYLGRDYPFTRGYFLNKRLAELNSVTIPSMMSLQLNNYDAFAGMAKPLVLHNINQSLLNKVEYGYFQELQSWKCYDEVNAIAPTIFQLVWGHLYNKVYNDEYADAPLNTLRPYSSTLLEALLKDSNYVFVDNVKTDRKENLKEIMTVAFKEAAIECLKLEFEKGIAWGKFKGTHIDHLLKISSFGRGDLPIGGGENAINAVKSDHGPSWRMIVQLTSVTEAYGIFPGGQSGNPGSRFYDNTVNYWTVGKYYPLWMMKVYEHNDIRIYYRMHFNN